MRRILVIRHGESEWNREGRWQGWTDIALTETGEAQARARGADLKAAGHRFAAISTSDLVRAARTAELIADALGGPTPRPERGLRERFGGEWQGRNREEIIAGWPREREAWQRGELPAPPGGESATELLGRVQATLTTLDATAPPGPILVVTHHGVVRQLSTRAGVPLTELLIANLGGRWFDLDGPAIHAGDPLPPLTAAGVTDLE